MNERMACEFFLIRYVPDVVKGEFVNIGVVLREAAGDPVRAQVRFTRDWGRVRCMDVDADLGLLEGLEQEIGLRLGQGVSDRDPKRVLEVLEDSLSNSVQMTEPRACLAENLATELEQLMRMYVEPLKMLRTKAAGAGAGAKSGRGMILGLIRTEFERAGVWGTMQKRIAAATYTRAGDPMRIDCGYGARGLGEAPRGAVRMFHAVSLDGEVESAKVLAFTAPMLREGVERVEAAELMLTAVVEPLRMVVDLDEASNGGSEAEERYRFGVETMERQQIRVVTLNDLARAAATAKRELRL